MNNLKGNRVYLSGSIDSCENRGKFWREEIGEILKKKFGCVILDPLNKRVKGLDRHNEDIEFAELRNKLWDEQRFDEFAHLMKETRHIDLRLIDRADFVIVSYDKTKHLCGTMEELFLANKQKKPVLIVCPQGKEEIPPWLWGTLPYHYFFSSFENLIKYLNFIDTTSYELIYDDRWLFFEE